MKYGLSADSLATSAGLKDGDLITKVNNKPLVYFNDLLKSIALTKKINLTVHRDGRDTMITMPQGFLSNLTKSQKLAFVSPRFPVVVDSVTPQVQYVSGKLQRGDQLIGLDDHSFSYYNEFDSLKQRYKNDTVTLIALRGGDTAQIEVKVNEEGSIGFLNQAPSKLLGTEKINYSFAQSIPAGINFGVERLKEYMTGIGLLFTSKEHKVKDNLGSVISIGKTFGGIWDWQRFWTMTALFSIILAFMNILPIPALDGGHALFTLYEMITGRKPSDKFMEYAQMVGMALLLGLMLYAFGLDIWRLFK